MDQMNREYRTNEPVMEVRNLKKYYPTGGGLLTRAVDGVSLTLRQGETFGVVGESGCGKSTVARLMMGLEKPTEGEVYFRGERIDNMREDRLRRLRPKFQMVFQDSGSSLNPRKRIEDIIVEPMRYHGLVKRGSAAVKAGELLEMVGLNADMGKRYPHEFSGGQRQRICIARALSLRPELIVLDEPVSALDVSVQAQILNLLVDLQRELGLTYLFIGHGLGAVHYISHRIAVMYMGKIVETGAAEDVFSHPMHPYTRALLDAAPMADFDKRNRERVILSGEVGERVPLKGCAFRDRCAWARSECALVDGSVQKAAQAHWSACPYER